MECYSCHKERLFEIKSNGDVVKLRRDGGVEAIIRDSQVFYDDIVVGFENQQYCHT